MQANSKEQFEFLKKIIKAPTGRKKSASAARFLNHLSINAAGAPFINVISLNESKPLDEVEYVLYKSVSALLDSSQKFQSNKVLQKGRPLKSISDQLKGKEGRFRQHLLGKRVDYSGRSVIIVGPTLKLFECGIPLIMAFKLFQPFLIVYITNRFNIASIIATKLIQEKHPIILILLKKFIETWPIILNRAPTLHRMNIQSFKIKLIQGKAILLHPLVCSSFNADFDGDQMGVHVPIIQESRAEAWRLLWSINNLIGLASRQPLFLPSQDMVIGSFYLTRDSFYQTLSPLYASFTNKREMKHQSSQ
uniref:RNA polymerase beta' subunit n=1 Tax=Cephaleuros virescens TaxID=173371 RepID=UPI001EE01181|nr:RNA polymerase beta' subunit [Cephaleuros virescens]UIB38646.1 RNA polymerase beta' subunit [Cephaleuros virescens]